MKRALFLCIVLFSFFALIAAAEEQPPSLTNFHRFYGQVTNLPTGTFALKASIGSTVYQTPIASGWYGVRPSFKVFGTTGQQITFKALSSLGAETALGNHTFQSASVTKLDFAFPTAGANVTTAGANATSNATAPAADQEDDDDEDRDAGATRRRIECRQSWECSAWSACVNSRQTRTCTDANHCAERKAAGNVTVIINIAKPSEQQACLAQAGAQAGAPVETIGTFCTTGEKRCIGRQLQQCSADGQRWNTMETCEQSCDPDALACVEPEEAIKKAPIAIPAWLYIVGGLILLGAASTLVVLTLLKRKKEYAPARQYIAENRGRGVPDAQIKQRLVGQGWDPEKVNSLLKS